MDVEAGTKFGAATGGIGAPGNGPPEGDIDIGGANGGEPPGGKGGVAPGGRFGMGGIPEGGTGNWPGTPPGAAK
jgi:hypothetical protein